jgi:Domain of unknown function (DUF397)
MEDTIDLHWRKSRYSGNGGGSCVEVGHVRRAVIVRDTKASGRGPVLRFSPKAWQRFTGAVKGS